MPLLHHRIGDDLGGATCTSQGAGIAIARNTVYVPCEDGALVAHRLP